MEPLSRAFRTHLPPGDLDFITRCLGGPGQASTGLLRLLTDPEMVDAILDQTQLFDAVVDTVAPLQVSSRFYFYLITRRSLLRAGLDDPEIADYISGVLDQHLACAMPSSRPQLFYAVDWIRELERQPKQHHFRLYVMAGNQLLFLTGIFPESIEHRRLRRGAPGLGFYEDVGRHSFRRASRHAMAEGEGRNLLARVADLFPDLRLALNDASARLLHMDN